MSRSNLSIIYITRIQLNSIRSFSSQESNHQSHTFVSCFLNISLRNKINFEKLFFHTCQNVLQNVPLCQKQHKCVQKAWQFLLVWLSVPAHKKHGKRKQICFLCIPDGVMVECFPQSMCVCASEVLINIVCVCVCGRLLLVLFNWNISTSCNPGHQKQQIALIFLSLTLMF